MAEVSEQYKALVVRSEKGGYSRTVENLDLSKLPENEVLIRVHYSSLNYKDALSATGDPGVTTSYPHTPGIDAAGIVVKSTDDRYKVDQKVIVTSYDLGMDTPGGFGQYLYVPGDWIVPLPAGLTMKESMIIGTAGFTAAYGVLKIVRGGISAGDGPVVITGATGGVGSFAVLLLSNLGYSVVAVTGKRDQDDFLADLGAAEIAGRDIVTDHSKKQLLKATWVAAVDVAGGNILDTIIRQTRHNGIVICCGNLASHLLTTNIYPFILRGVSLTGVDSGICLMSDRLRIWKKLATEWKPRKLDRLYREVNLDQLSRNIDAILQGSLTGRVLINLRD